MAGYDDDCGTKYVLQVSQKKKLLLLCIQQWTLGKIPLCATNVKVSEFRVLVVYLVNVFKNPLYKDLYYSNINYFRLTVTARCTVAIENSLRLAGI